MKRIGLAIIAVVYLLALPCTSRAQTTYTMAQPPQWDVTEHSALGMSSPFSYGSWNIIKLVDANGNVVSGSFELEGGIVLVTLPGVSVDPGNYFNNTWNATSLTQPGTDCTPTYANRLPACPDPGSFSFTWQELQPDGVTYVNGTASGTWQRGLACGRYCYSFVWFQTFSVVVN